MKHIYFVYWHIAAFALFLVLIAGYFILGIFIFAFGTKFLDVYTKFTDAVQVYIESVKPKL